MKRIQKKIGELLIEKGMITKEQLDSALAEQALTKEFLGSVLVRMGYIKEEGFLKALSQQFTIPYVHVTYDYIDWEFVSRFSPTLVVQYRCCPLKADEYAITVAISNPLDAWAIKKAEEETRGYTLKIVLVAQKDMDGLISRYKEYIQKKGL